MHSQFKEITFKNETEFNEWLEKTTHKKIFLKDKGQDLTRLKRYYSDDASRYQVKKYKKLLLKNEYFKDRKSYEVSIKGKKVFFDIDEIKRLFSNFPHQIDLSKIEPLKGDPSLGKVGLYRVRLDNSIYRIILVGFVFERTFIARDFCFFNYVDDESYKKFLKKVDEGLVVLYPENTDNTR